MTRMMLATLLAATALSTAGIGLAATISGVTVTNNSSPNFTLDAVANDVQFRSSISNTAVQSSGSSVFFSSRLAFVAAMNIGPGGPTVALTNPRQAYMQIVFTVEDPTNIGYTLDIDSVLRGYSTLTLASGTFAQVTYGTGNAFLSVDGAPGTLLLPISLMGTGTVNNTTVGSTINQLTDQSSTYTSGTFVGTHTFRLQYAAAENLFTNNLNGLLFNNNTGEVALRFGENVTLPDLAGSATPGVDGDTADSLGLRTTITANFNGPISDVPEPSTYALTAAGLALAVAQQRRRKR